MPPTEVVARTNGVHRLGSCTGRELSGIALLLMLLVPMSALAQEGEKIDHNPPPREQSERRDGREPLARRPLPGGVFRRLRELTPEQQRRFMANDPEFRSFAPMRQNLIRERLRQWNAMTPEEKERIRQREEIFASLSPDQRREARLLFPQWRELPAERRQALMVAFRHLRDLPPDQRRGYLDSQDVKENFSPTSGKFSGA